MADARTRLYCEEETQEHHSIELRKPSIISHLTCIGALFFHGKITILKKIRNIDTYLWWKTPGIFDTLGSARDIVFQFLDIFVSSSNLT